jgi:mono/diheme cytochrome c family protein
MIEPATTQTPAASDGGAHAAGSDGLWRWLVAGLATGLIVLGLLVAAYAIGYHRGQDNARAASNSPSGPATTTTTTTPPPAAGVGTVIATPALVAQGKTLYTTTGCAACHSISGSAGVGPTFKGLAGSSVPLTNGQTVTATDAYLAQSISAPDAQIVKGYQAGVMSAAVAGYNLASNPDKIRALVAFIKAQK